MKRFASTLFTAAVLTALAVGAAHAITYPTGLIGSLPGGPCPDTLLISNVQDPSASCHPAAGSPGDSLLGIKCRVIALDKDFGPFALYIQQAGGGPWSGIQLFTSSGNYATGGIAHGGVNINVGDDVAVYGDYEEFAGRSEIATGSIPQPFYKLVRRISTGNASPPYHIGTTTELNWIPAISAATAEQWEGTLVKIRTKLKVKRNLNALGLGSRSFLAVNNDGSAPTDSIAVDGFELTNIPAPATETVIDSVQGVFTQTSIGGVPSYRILLRGTDDLFAALPPSVTDAYPISDTQIRVVYDRPVDSATGEQALNYTFSSGSIATNAVFEAGASQKVVIVTTDNSAGYTHGLSETITASNIVSTSGTLQTTPQQRTFAFGVLTLNEVQAPEAGRLGGAPCADGSAFSNPTGTSGTRVTFRGIVTHESGITYWLEDPINNADTGARHGMIVFRPNSNLQVGNQYLIAGQIQEFDGTSASIPGGVTEGVNVVYLKDEGPKNIPAPRIQTIAVLSDTSCDAGQVNLTGEDFEGVLVRILNAKIVEERTAGQAFLIAGPSPTFPDTFLVSNTNAPYTFDPDSLDIISVTGVIDENPAAAPIVTHPGVRLRYRIIPRNNADINTNNTANVPGSKRDAVSMSVTNPSRTARVHFTLPRTGNVELAVYDLTGRKLATLAKGVLPAGDYSRSWNGNDGEGKGARAGMYFYRLKVDGELLSTKAVKLD